MTLWSVKNLRTNQNTENIIRIRTDKMDYIKIKIVTYTHQKITLRKQKGKPQREGICNSYSSQMTCIHNI